MHCQVAWWPFPSPVGCHAVHDKATGVPDVTHSTDHFYSQQTEYASLNIQKKVPMALQAEGTVFGFSFFCSFVMPFLALFCFCIKGMKPASVKHMEYYFTEVCALQLANTTSREHKYSSIWNFPPLLGLHSPQFQLSCHFPDCYTLILSDKLFSFSFVSLCRDSL